MSEEGAVVVDGARWIRARTLENYICNEEDFERGGLIGSH